MNFLKDFRVIWIYLRKYKKDVVRISFLAVVFALFSGIIPYLYGRLVDIVSSGSFSFLVFALLGIWALTSLVSEIFRRIVSLRGGFLGAEASSDLILETASHVMTLPLNFHKENRVGEIVSRITRAGEYLRDITENTLFWILPQFLTMLIGLIVLFFINWQLFLGIVIIFFISVVITVLRVPFLMKTQKEVNKKIDYVAGNLNDSFLNIQTIKSSSAEAFQDEKLKKGYKQEVVPNLKKVLTIWENTTFFQEIIFSLGFVLIFSWALFLLSSKAISAGVLVMFLGYLNLTRMPLRTLLWQWLTVQRGLTTIKRARDLLELGREDYNKKGKILDDIKGKVEFKKVSFNYQGKSLVLRGINLKAEPGQKIALVGGSGEGKTTIADLLSLYYKPKTGEILIDGIDIKKFDLSFLRSIIAYVPQEIVLFNDTIKNNILYGRPSASDEEVFEAARIANADHFINYLPKKYDALVGERGIKLSTGQKQRLAIARAVIRNPKILVLDEATSSLDVKSEILVQKAIEALTQNKTTFIIAHRLSTVRKADKILVISKGRIVEEGRHEQLMKKKGLYYNFYTLQFSEDSYNI
jgi:ABC-type multidrug transport system fused ATPase/permease subunit